MGGDEAGATRTGVSRRAIEQLLELLPEAAILVAADDRIVAVNARAGELAGAPTSELRGAPLESMFEMAGGLAADGGAVARPLECTMTCHEGGRRPVEISSRAMTVDGERLVLAIVRDVTERKRVVDELRGSEERLRQAVRVSGIGIFDHDHATDVHYWSTRQRAMYGWPDDEPITVPRFLERLYPDDREAIAAGIRRAHDPAGDGAFDVEHRIIRSDGQVRWIATRSITLFAGEGAERRPVRTIGASVDFTDLKQREEDQRRLSAMLDATPDFVGLGDVEGRIFYLNRAARELLGLGPSEDPSKLGIRERHPEWAAKLTMETAIPHAVRDGSWRGETAFLRKDGSEVPFSQVVLAHRGSDGNVAFLSTIARDVSNEKKLEAQLLQAQKMEAIGRLAGGVAHDFNNLLSVILNATTLAQRSLALSHPVQADLEDVRVAGERAAELTRRMLVFSRKQVLRPQVIDVNEVLRGLSPMLRRLVREHIDLTFALAADLAPIRADPTHLEQVVLNLVVNACDAMPSGGRLAIETRNAPVDEAPGAQASTPTDPGSSSLVAIAVSDTGIGMDAATRARIFEPFFTTKAPGEGTGLGLAMIFGFVKQSGGEIAVRSDPGRGTTFTLYFPSAGGAPASRPRAPAAPTSSTGSETVLLVEDEGQLRKLVARVLERSGYRVLAAAGPLAALEMSRRHEGPIDLLLTDVVMPDMSGDELADRLTAERADIRVLMMSGYAERGIGRRGEGRPCLQKPFTFDDLLATVRGLLDRDPTR